MLRRSQGMAASFAVGRLTAAFVRPLGVVLGRFASQGGAQLSTDVEYFVNLMAALHVDPHAPLLALQLAAGAPAADFAGLARSAAADGGPEVARVLRALAAMRGLSPPEGS
jgi:hypothetical protein